MYMYQSCVLPSRSTEGSKRSFVSDNTNTTLPSSAPRLSSMGLCFDMNYGGPAPRKRSYSQCHVVNVLENTLTLISIIVFVPEKLHQET